MDITARFRSATPPSSSRHFLRHGDTAPSPFLRAAGELLVCIRSTYLYEQKGFVTQVYDAIRALERIIDEIREKYFESQQIEAFQNIILYLNEQLINRQMKIVERERQKDKEIENIQKVLNPEVLKKSSSLGLPPLYVDDFKEIDRESSPAQKHSEFDLQILERENQQFFKSLDTQLEFAKKTEKTVNVISTMISEFNTKVSQQQDIIAKISKDTGMSIDNARKAEKELEKALSIESGSRSITLTFLLVATASLWFLHWYND